jgi:hypothetical protein
MATIDLGKIKQVWRGTYASGTAYTPDDVVEYTDSGILSSYICVANTTGNAPSSSGTAHASWNYLAKGGAAGTDVGTTITTQGDILYRDGSGLQRLGAGTSGQALLTGGAGANPSWGSVSAVAGTKNFYAYYNQNSSQLTSSANTELVFNAEMHDTESVYNVSNGRYTPGVVGTYFVSSTVTCNDINGAGDEFYLKFFINGVATGHQYGGSRTNGAGETFNQFVASAVIPLTSASDYISAYVYQNAGGSRFAQGEMSNFIGFRLT